MFISVTDFGAMIQIIIGLLKCSFVLVLLPCWVLDSFVVIMFRNLLTLHIISGLNTFLVTGGAFEDNRFRETVEYNDADSYNIDGF